jgi:amidophosphoribosyltransferase
VTTVHAAPERPHHCVFELIYFSRPDSETFDEHVYAVRERIGACLAGKDADLGGGDDLVVMPVPDSSNFVALGYAAAKGARVGMGLLRNHYVGRTFIKPNQKSRDEGVKQKFNPLPGFFPGKRVVLVDDSIVRGTSLRKLVRMLKAAGAREVHVRISCPPTISPCFYGVDTPSRSELIAATHTLDEIQRYLEADSLRYLSLEGLLASVNSHRSAYCTSCYTGRYPVAFPGDEASYLQLSLKLPADGPVAG